MRDFLAIHQALGLKKLAASPLGTLYFVPAARGAPRVIVRHFDGAVPAALVEPFANFVRASQLWIERHTDLQRLVRIEQPIEVGRDFIARTHHTYTSTRAFSDSWDEPLEPPEELEEMRDAFRAASERVTEPWESMLVTILARSVLEPSGKTFFDEDERRFVIVEPKPTPDELERWADLRPTPADAELEKEIG